MDIVDACYQPKNFIEEEGCLDARRAIYCNFLFNYAGDIMKSKSTV